MTDQKPTTPYDAASVPTEDELASLERTDEQAPEDDEHDGWGEIQRRPSDPG